MSAERRRSGGGCLAVLVAAAFVLFMAFVWLGVRVSLQDGALVVEWGNLSALTSTAQRDAAREAWERQERLSAAKRAKDETVKRGEGDNLYEALGGLVDVPELGYLGERLSEWEQEVYVQLYDAVANKREEAEITGVENADAVQDVWLCVLDDHPEFFWLDGGFSYGYDDAARTMLVKFGLATPLDQVDDYKARVEECAADFQRDIAPDASEYDIALAAYDYVIGNTEYVKGAPNDQNILSVFVGGQSVCAGYARSFQYLLLRSGMFCALARGQALSTGGESEGHVWNLLSIDDVCAYVDPAWGDRGGRPQEPGAEDWGDVCYAFFGMTTDEVIKTGHAFDHEHWWPECSSHELNYYYREGMLFDSYEREWFQGLVCEKIDAGETQMEFQFSDADAWAACRQDIKEGGCLQELPSWLGARQARWRLLSSELTHVMRLSWVVE